MPAAVWLGGVALHRLGFIVSNVPRFLEGPIRTRQSVAIPGRAGGVFLDDGTTELRELVIEGAFVRETAALREAAEEALKVVLYGQSLIEVRVRDARNTVRVTYALPINRASHDPLGPLFRTRGSRLILPLFCPDATWRAEEPVILGLSSTPREIPHWGAPTDAVIRVHGPGTAITLEFRTAGGLLTTEMALGDLDATDFLEVDIGAETVEEVIAGAADNGLARIGDDPFPAYGLTPLDGEGQTVTLTGGASGDLWVWPRSL